jgi:hypothetical protein
MSVSGHARVVSGSISGVRQTADGSAEGLLSEVGALARELAALAPPLTSEQRSRLRLILIGSP